MCNTEELNSDKCKSLQPQRPVTPYAPQADIGKLDIDDATAREILNRLIEYKAARATIRILQESIEQGAKLQEQIQQNQAKELDLEKAATELAKRETALAERERDFYKNAYESAKQVIQPPKKSSSLKRGLIIGAVGAVAVIVSKSLFLP